MKAILKNQKVRIDYHCGTGTVPTPTWNDNKVHLHKQSLDKKKGAYEIKIPINHKLPIEVNGEKGQKIPSRIRKEIEDALSNEKCRKEFTESVLSILNEYPKFKENDDNAIKALKRIAEAFGLKWDCLINVSKLHRSKDYRALIYDENNKIYFVSINTKRVLVGDTLRKRIEASITNDKLNLYK